MNDSVNASIDEATRRQQDAASPSDNVFVSANAGSGKTRVLVSRVSRLLLKGVPPAKILCLTYTKAAAGEMQSRLFETLGEWSVYPDDKLQVELAKLDGNKAARTATGLTAARRLFARALETPEGLKVQTIHAFCERLLRRFPIEAGIAPGYEALEDNERADILARVKTEIGEAALSDPTNDIAKAIAFLAARYANQKLDAVYARAAMAGHDTLDWAQIGPEPLAQFLGVNGDETPQILKAAAWNKTPKDAIKSAAHDMSQSGVTNQATAQIIYDALTCEDAIQAWDIYSGVFFTKAGSPKSVIAASKIAADLFGSEKHGYGSEAERVFEISERLACLNIFQETCAVLTLSTAVAKAYNLGKRMRRRMDFDDQIRLARDLLKNSAAREWVSYKLDGGVDHILIDEAQDTGPDQWDIIDHISAEFNVVENSGRTKFAVGDEKQSIYGFQGARPDLFLSRFQALTLEAARARSVQLTMSFRSAPHVLDFVDTIFADCGAAKDIFDIAPAGDITRHVASRTDAGRVELWPLTKAPEKTETETAWDETPPDALASNSSREQLAVNISLYIRDKLLAGEQVYDRDSRSMRPVKPGDIMILARKRGPFFNAIIRNLKFAGVAVAGADVLEMTSNIGVQDLMSLGKFIALPSDDLSLAEVLKSPIFGLSDEDLILLTADRGDANLWTQLNTLTLPAHLIEARGTLRKILAFAPGLAPYEFYARILSTLMTTPGQAFPDSILKRLYSRLGIEAADPVEAFLGKALAHQRSGPPSLDKFLREMAGDGSTLKRQPDARADEVRVMTVHGAKGLEAPVIILPDTTQTPSAKGGTFDLDSVPGGGRVVQPSSADMPLALQPLQDARERAAKQEYLRQFYVALTRAESRLIICGFQSGGPKKALPEGCWYDWARRAFEHMSGVAPNSVMTEISPLFEEPLKVFGPVQRGAMAGKDNKSETAIPDWAQTAAPQPAKDMRYVTPSHLLGGPTAGSPALKSPLMPPDKKDGQNPFARGIAIHKLLEILPQVELSRREDVARSYLAAQTGIDAGAAAGIFAEVFSVLKDPQFKDLFAPGSRAEVSLAGSASELPAGVFINAQIDRLAVTDKEVWIVDYKSNRPPPVKPEDVSNVYVAQMAAYRALARDIYPKKTVRCALLWTDAARLMELPQSMLDAFDFRAALS